MGKGICFASKLPSLLAVFRRGRLYSSFAPFLRFNTLESGKLIQPVTCKLGGGVMRSRYFQPGSDKPEDHEYVGP
jgi:hypothetical protein